MPYLLNSQQVCTHVLVFINDLLSLFNSLAPFYLHVAMTRFGKGGLQTRISDKSALNIYVPFESGEYHAGASDQLRS